jgi:hypothetical protein
VSAGLYAANHPAGFWRLLRDPAPTPHDWELAARAAAPVLPPEVAGGDASLADVLERTLGEGQFGPDHWRLPRSRRLYYLLKPLLPRALTVRLRQAHKDGARRGFRLGWPIEDRYARFLWETAGHLMDRAGERELPFVHFWPHGRRFALVLTHDIETAEGQAWVPVVAGLEERLGFRSSFNFVAERYPVDPGLVRDLRDRGFEVGVHGLKHDGRKLRSRRAFERRSHKINAHLQASGAVGFRSPLTHRNPEWMQSLQIEYDSSFFDSDPFEPIPGGTMSLWPFLMGRFVELPYTLPQDFTLTDVLGERSARTWLEKTAFIARFSGMALLNTHPDYLRDPARWRPYQEFLERMAGAADHWHALPREVARWWRRRLAAPDPAALPGAAEGRLVRSGRGGVELVLPGDAGLSRAQDT